MTLKLCIFGVKTLIVCHYVHSNIMEFVMSLFIQLLTYVEVDMGCLLNNIYISTAGL